MEMYTELVLKAKIIENLPDDIDKILNYIFNYSDETDLYLDDNETLKEGIKLPNHEFFKCRGWKDVGHSNSYYHIPACLNYYSQRYIFTRCDLKDYFDEIDKFIDWIKPYLRVESGTFIGWKWQEEWYEPEFIYS